MTNRSDGLADFLDMTAVRFGQDYRFRLRLLAEADETPRETALRVRREAHTASLRRTAS